MTPGPGWWRRLIALWRRDAFEEGLTDEIQFHIDQQTAKNIRLGMTPAEARRRARLAFGGREPIKEQVHEARSLHFLETLTQDLRYALRVLRKAPGFTATAILTLALGIGATTTTFSVISGLMLRTPSVRDSNAVMVVSSTPPADVRGPRRSPVSASDYADWRERATDFAGLAAGQFDGLTLSGSMTPLVVQGARVSSDFFRVLGIQAVFGRVIQPGDDRADADPVAVLSEDVWR
jgi:hypothetical protein